MSGEPESVDSQVVKAADLFEQAWKAGKRPEIDKYLERFAVSDSPVRSELFKALLDLELFHRRKAGDTPKQSEYLSRYPQYIASVNEVFLEHKPVLAPVTSAGIVLEPGREPVPGYRLESRLGEGGFGEVWKARQGRFAVALKFVSLRKAGALTLEERSLDILREVRHPNLLTHFGDWQKGGYLIVAMELGDCTLFDRMRDYQKRDELLGIPLEELLEYTTQAAKGIDYLNHHTHSFDGKPAVGVQHRDIKPQNILVVGSSVKVADFGLARILEKSHTKHTGAQSVAYAAPEFLGADSQVSDRSDQYSLAITFHELLTGKLPFKGETIGQIIFQKLFKEPDLTALPAEFRPVIARALARDPKERWPNCAAFVDALHRPPRRPPSPPPPLVAPFAPDHAKAAQAAWSRALAMPVELALALSPNVKLKMMLIAPGKFLMGSPEDEKDRCKNERLHEVEIVRPFYLGTYQVTQEEFQLVMGMNLSAFDPSPRLPAQNISWDMASAFCGRIAHKLSRPYGLPTEAEWEYACRAGTTSPFHFGASMSTSQANFDGSKPRRRFLRWAGLEMTSELHQQTYEVGSYPPNAFGLFDMHGNVWEWCEDRYDEAFFSRSPLKNPLNSTVGTSRVLRGGSCFDFAMFCRAAYRHQLEPSVGSNGVGFRLALHLG